ncbi:MAG: ankyrin repeat domain-containing protein [Vicinamibacterales bacterium]|nr:ankyrin repeat domain-containing protein [Vicinamibacterales bacterium]
MLALGLGYAGIVEAQPARLVNAAKQGEMAAVRALLDQGARVDATEGDGTTALHWASYHDDVDVVGLLLDAGADVNAANDLGATALWAASQNGGVAVVTSLLAAGADPSVALRAGETPLMVAARAGASAVVELLLTHGAAPDARGARGQTALMWAVAQQHPTVVEVLLAHDADVHARSDVWTQMMAVPPHGQPEYNREIPHGGNTALLFAARAGDVVSARHLIAAGADVDDADAWGVSATVLAAHSGFDDLVDLLLEAGADPNAAAAGFGPLHVAVMRRDERIVAALLDHGADPNAVLRTWTPTRRSSRDLHFPPPLVGATPFWLAARFTAPAIMRLLAQGGADPLFVHRADYKEPAYALPRLEATTALMAATGMGGGRLRAWVPATRAETETLTLEAARLAVQLGVDVNATGTDGRTALDGARATRLDSVVAFLESQGAVSGAP